MGDRFMISSVIVVGALIIAFCTFFITGKPDTPIEQAAEAVAEYELGLPIGSIDVSKEEKK